MTNTLTLRFLELFQVFYQIIRGKKGQSKQCKLINVTLINTVA